jgi:hypothetical protein
VEIKHAIFLVAVVLVLTVGRAVCKRSGLLRDACAFLLVIGTTRTDFLDINFLSREWYRGTTRGVEFSWLDLLWILLLVSLPANDVPRRRLPTLSTMLVFFSYNALVVAFSEPTLFGIFELSKMVRQLCLFYTMARYVEGERELSILAWALIGAVGYEFLSSLRGRIVWKLPRAQGTVGHANTLSMYELMMIPVLVGVAASNASRKLRYASGIAALFGVATLLFTVSRNGVLTVSVIGIFLLFAFGSIRRMTARHVGLGMVAAGVIGVFVAMTYDQFKARFESEGVDKEYGGNVYEGRGAYLLTAQGIAEHEPFGCGLNNWSWCVSARYGRIVEQYYIPYESVDTRPPKRRLRRHAHIDDQQAAPAHSLYAITLGETGYLGVALYGLVWAHWFVLSASFLRNRSSALRARFSVGVLGSLIGAFGQSFSEWEVRQTPLAFLLHILLGAVAASKLRVESEEEKEAART